MEIRSSRWRVAIPSAILCLAALLTSSACQAQTKYQIRWIDVANGSAVYGYGVNDVGQVAGTVEYKDGTKAAFYTDFDAMGDPITIPTLGGPSNSATGISGAGMVVGSSDTASGKKAFLAISSSVTDIRAGESGTAAAEGISFNGIATGYYETASGKAHGFTADGVTFTDIGTLIDGGYSHGIAANSSGHAVGYANGTSFSAHAVFYDGTLHDLGALGANESWAYAINENDEVVGSTSTTGGGYHAFKYAGGTMTDLGALTTDGISLAYGINDLGVVVGTSRSSGVDSAFVVENGTMYDLNTLVSLAPGCHLNEARGIALTGYITGYGVGPTGKTQAFLLSTDPTPVPEAGTLMSLGSLLGMSGLALVRKRSNSRRA